MERNSYSVFLPHSHSLNLPTIFSLLLIASAGAPKAIKSHYRNIFIYAHLAQLISIVSPPNTNLTSGWKQKTVRQMVDHWPLGAKQRKSGGWGDLVDAESGKRCGNPTTVVDGAVRGGLYPDLLLFLFAILDCLCGNRSRDSMNPIRHWGWEVGSQYVAPKLGIMDPGHQSISVLRR